MFHGQPASARPLLFTEPGIRRHGLTEKLVKAQGFALIDILFVVGLIGILAGIALPRLVLARQSAYSASAIGSMRAINSGQLTYALTCGNGFYAPNLTTLGTPPAGSQAPYISPELGGANTVTKSGYIIQVSGTAYPGAPATCNGLAFGAAAQGFKAAADATDASNSRFFATNSSGTIFEDTASLFASMPEVGSPPSGHPTQ